MNPPPKVIEGYFKRVGNLSSKGGGSAEALQSGTLFFDKHALMVKKWNLEMNMTKEEVQTVDVWVQLPGLHVKYWSNVSLSKIVSQIDHHTARRTRLAYARVLVEVPINQELTEEVTFENEKGMEVRQPIHYEWMPLKCHSCGMHSNLRSNAIAGHG
ncbi:hypothetical protein Cgig2_013659 [Carnegiea gigantea]|uniref:DUF4283 domain-containing protein n=1 Tax=Carnegiea gigantea TaxID=171969 RepID=A0A9Q1Q8B5_9CARY|nr:hypothetical protein Cgig2_013659 [Carnegiea gigantea]